MKKSMAVLLAAALFPVMAAAQTPAPKPAEAKPAAAVPAQKPKPAVKAAKKVQRPAAAVQVKDNSKTLYSLGYLIGQNVDFETLMLTSMEYKQLEAGFADAARNSEPKYVIAESTADLRVFAEERAAVRTASEKTKGEAYAAKRLQEKGAAKLASGVIIISEKEGSGPMPAATDTVKVDYEGSLIDGTVFDSSIQRGTPAEFPLNAIIPCWSEALQKMKAGAKATLVCSSSAAYGDAGRPRKIPGGATLVFKVSLLEIVPPPPPPAPAAEKDAVKKEEKKDEKKDEKTGK
ncbi:MAG: FKBP-type peptidyl-prolyl cis-trans isomerase [Elusimicrobiales bacterium]|nr:FKBP-type peptidyl-prolyl cis-trans isomerase [Elusimicrobiales bacterium]